MEPHDFEPKLAQAVQNVEKYGSLYGDANALSIYLQDMKKVVLATQMAKSEAKSIAAKEMEALQSEEYRNHLEAAKEAAGEAGRCKAQYVRWQSQFESLRSLISFTKRQMDLI